jgi:hypothetical protein
MDLNAFPFDLNEEPLFDLNEEPLFDLNQEVHDEPYLFFFCKSSTFRDFPLFSIFFL